MWKGQVGRLEIRRLLESPVPSYLIERFQTSSRQSDY